uniref:Uncharacterized protein n=2 Tax=Vibrio TaxID=662 RepID=A0A0H3ZLK0_9VIBR|nr:hypothetical protein [Vibrio cyclitrophicus]AKN38248.1 hypothetical protein [Vibrio splendidus]
MSETSLNAIVAEYKRRVKGIKNHSEIRAISIQFGLTVKSGVFQTKNQAT